MNTYTMTLGFSSVRVTDDHRNICQFKISQHMMETRFAVTINGIIKLCWYGDVAAAEITGRCCLWAV